MANTPKHCLKLITETYAFETALTEFFEGMDYVNVTHNEERVYARLEELGKFILDNVQDFNSERE